MRTLRPMQTSPPEVPVSRSPQAPQLLGHPVALPLLAFENVVEGFGNQLVEAGAQRGHDGMTPAA
jgi:hypothetical protein